MHLQTCCFQSVDQKGKLQKIIVYYSWQIGNLINWLIYLGKQRNIRAMANVLQIQCHLLVQHEEVHVNAIIWVSAALELVERWPLGRVTWSRARCEWPWWSYCGSGWDTHTHQPTSLLDMQDTCRRTHIEGSLDTWSAHYKGGSQHECGYIPTSIFHGSKTLDAIPFKWLKQNAANPICWLGKKFEYFFQSKLDI